MATRILTCVECDSQFTVEVRRGKTHAKYCSKQCASSASERARKLRLAQCGQCSVDGCQSPITRIGAGLCEKHYMRLRRNGHLLTVLEETPPPATIEHSHGYLLEYAPSHPLKKAGGNRVYQHRKVFYDTHGDGPFDCHWCGIQVTWQDMHVDHLNAVRDDNRIDNLVASCAKCNQARGHESGKATHRAKSKAAIEFNGERLTAGEWAERLGVSRNSITWRLNNGWSIDRALTQGRGKFGPKRRA